MLFVQDTNKENGFVTGSTFSILPGVNYGMCVFTFTLVILNHYDSLLGAWIYIILGFT